MRRPLLALSLLCLLTFSLAAHADQIDDFVISGNYDNGGPFPPFTFSAENTGIATISGPTLPYPEVFVPILSFDGHPESGFIFTGYPAQEISFGVGGFGISPPGEWLSFTGDLGTTNPAYLTYTFHPGTYSASYYAYLSNATHLTLTITPEVSTTPSPIPEPSSLLLVGTGLLSAATLARRKLLSRAATHNPQSLSS